MNKKIESDNQEAPEPKQDSSISHTQGLPAPMVSAIRDLVFSLLIQIPRLQMGAGDRTFKADQQGIWLGAKKFEDAPFRVTTEGKVYFNGVLQN